MATVWHHYGISLGRARERFGYDLAATPLKLRSEMELNIGVLLHCDLEGVGRLG